jgi:predicted ATP-grasp superfamily ATP-dependent carboligase
MYRLVTPPPQVTRFALDKRLTYSRAAELGIAAPRTWTAERSEAVEDAVEYPAILKPAVNHHFFPHTNVKALPINNREELHARFAQMARYIAPAEILIQERIAGGGENQFSFCAASSDGQVYATLVAQRRRQYPVDFGNASSFVQTTSQPVVERDGRRFLESIGFDGMAEVEFKYDPRDGRYKILDVNPRPWGWHTLGRAAGVDFVRLTWEQKVGHQVSQHKPKHNATWIREITDPLAILKSGNRLAEFTRLIKAVATGRFTLAAFDLLDPVPFFAEFVLWASSGLARQKKAQGVLTDS